MSGKPKYAIRDVDLLVQAKGGLCLSREYEAWEKKLEVKCKCDHVWNVSFKKLKQGRWCPNCGGVRQKTLEDYCLLAKKIGGKFLGKTAAPVNSLSSWICSEGHVFQGRFNDLNRGTRCFRCSRISAKQKYIERYGVDNPTKNRNIRLKAIKSSNKQSKLTHWLSNEKIYCQGSWERAVANYFNQNKIDYNWQVQTFLMPDGKTYTPDCYLPDEDLWIEIKGYFYKDAKEKWDWFHKEYPNSELWNKKKLKELRIL